MYTIMGCGMELRKAEAPSLVLTLLMPEVLPALPHPGWSCSWACHCTPAVMVALLPCLHLPVFLVSARCTSQGKSYASSLPTGPGTKHDWRHTR